MQFTNHNRASQLTNQSRLGSAFRQRMKRGAAAQAFLTFGHVSMSKEREHIHINLKMNIIMPF